MNYPIQNVSALDLTFSAHFDYFNDIRHPEDGTQLEGTAHYIVAETPDGHRFTRHYKNSCWIDAVTEDDEPFVYLSEPLEDIQAMLAPIVDKLNASMLPRLRPEVWSLAEPCYGTQAWLNWHQEQIMDEDYMNQ